jgi:hypothetical protein
MKSTRMIADNVSEWKRSADGLRNGWSLFPVFG